MVNTIFGLFLNIILISWHSPLKQNWNTNSNSASLVKKRKIMCNVPAYHVSSWHSNNKTWMWSVKGSIHPKLLTMIIKTDKRYQFEFRSYQPYIAWIIVNLFNLFYMPSDVLCSVNMKHMVLFLDPVNSKIWNDFQDNFTTNYFYIDLLFFPLIVRESSPRNV